MTFRTPRLPVSALIAAALTLSACGTDSDDKPAAASPTEAAAPAAPTAAADTRKDAPAAPSTSTKTDDPALAAYVGKYPFDKVDGVAFSDHPRVKAGIAATVTDARVRTAITSTPGPAAPIESIGGKVAAWSCQQHKCGEHQWMVMIDPATGATDVCYMNDPAMAGQSRWFLAGGKEEKRDGDCSSERN